MKNTFETINFLNAWLFNIPQVRLFPWSFCWHWMGNKNEKTHCIPESGLWLLFDHFARLKTALTTQGRFCEPFHRNLLYLTTFSKYKLRRAKLLQIIAKKCKPKILFHCLRKKCWKKETGYQVFPTPKTMCSFSEQLRLWT